MQRFKEAGWSRQYPGRLAGLNPQGCQGHHRVTVVGHYMCCRTFFVHVLVFFFEKYRFPITFIISLPRRCITNKQVCLLKELKSAFFCTNFIDSFIVDRFWCYDINFQKTTGHHQVTPLYKTYEL